MPKPKFFARGLVVFCGLSLAAMATSRSQAQWVSPPGTGWVSIDVYRHATSQHFNPLARKTAIPDEGRAVTTSTFVTGNYGLVRGVDVWIQVPVHRSRFDDVAGDRLRTGLGDPLAHVRITPELFGANLPIPLALRAGVKVPGADFEVDAEIVPLGEGQRDWELIGEMGMSFWPRPVYASGWIGYRWRETNDETGFKPGDEWFAFAKIGGRLKGVILSLAVETLRGRSPQAFGLSLQTSRREVFQILPDIGIHAGPGNLMVGVRLPVAGRNLPAGPAIKMGYFITWGD